MQKRTIPNNTMVFFRGALAIFSALASGVVALEETCSAIGLLGAKSWERFGAALDISVDDDCMFTWTFDFKHDEALPIPDTPVTQCDPATTPPDVASDRIPFYAFRGHYETVPDYFSKATGINHISLDFNPCGHPPMIVFTAPHYDLHTYQVSPEFRTCMLCDTFPGAPLCDFTQTQPTESGQAFFVPITQDLPAGYVNNPADAVITMGGHAWDPADEPTSTATWTEPVMVMGAYDGKNIYYEPMPPLSFVTGTTDKLWEYDIVYQNQVTANLASYAAVSYSGTTKIARMTFKGPSSICRKEFEEIRFGKPSFFDKVLGWLNSFLNFLWNLFFGWL